MGSHCEATNMINLLHSKNNHDLIVTKDNAFALMTVSLDNKLSATYHISHATIMLVFLACCKLVVKVRDGQCSSDVY